MDQPLPNIPAKRYFTIGEVSELCGVKPHVLRYWEQEFKHLRPMKRRGNRRYYQHHEVLMIRRIRDLLYDQGFTISGARNKLQEIVQSDRDRQRAVGLPLNEIRPVLSDGEPSQLAPNAGQEIQTAPAIAKGGDEPSISDEGWTIRILQVRRELSEIRDLLSAALDRAEVGRDSHAII